MSRMEKVQSYDEKWKETEKRVQSRRVGVFWVWLACVAVGMPSVYLH